MIKVLIAGPPKTGKSHVLLCLTKILSNAGLKVLAVDTTKHCGMQNFFHPHLEPECLESSDAPPVICRYGFDVMLLGTIPDSKRLDEFSQNYDAVLVETDKIILGMAGQYPYAVFVQDSNLDSLVANEKLLKAFKQSNHGIPVRLLLNQYLPCKLTVKYICHTLNISIEYLNVISLNLDDMTASYNQKMDGRLRLNNYSKEHNRVLFKLVCEISGIQINRKNARLLIK